MLYHCSSFVTKVSVPDEQMHMFPLILLLAPKTYKDEYKTAILKNNMYIEFLGLWYCCTLELKLFSRI